MKLREIKSKFFENSRECGLAFENPISEYMVNNIIDRELLELADGRFILTGKNTKILTTEKTT